MSKRQILVHTATGKEVQAGETIRLWSLDVKIEFVFPREQNMVEVSYWMGQNPQAFIRRGPALLGMEWRDE